MEQFLLYIGKASLAAGTFYLLYLALFQHQKHFVFNRIYLPVSLAVSFLIPLITFTSVSYVDSVNTATTDSFAYLPQITEIANPEFVYQWFHYLFGLYVLGILGFLGNLLVGHLKAISIVRFSRIKELFNASVNITPKDVHPFSFFNKIVLSENTLDNPNLEIIVSHEKIHVDEKHTLDILFAEILFLLQWFNPFAWLIKAAMRDNLEYKTDHQVTQNNNAEAYQLAMVGLVHKEGVAPFNALNGSQLKNRIIMMKKKTENKYALLKQLVVLPLLAVLVMGLSNKKVEVEIIENTKEVKIENMTSPTLVKETTITGRVSDEKVTPIPAASEIIKNTSQDTSKKEEVVVVGYGIQKNGSLNETFQIRASNGDTENQPLFIVNGEEIENIESLQADDIESISVLKDSSATEKYGEKGENGVVQIVTKKAAPVQIKITGDTENQPLYIVDGKEIADINSIQPDDIESISVLKDESATSLYGEKGTNGVVVVTTKEAAKKNPTKPLIMVDGKKYDGDMDDIDPETIKSVDVLKNESATKLYGPAAKDGVVKITTKHKVDFGDKSPLVIVDGVKKGKNSDYMTNDIDPDNIESISVLKDASATEIYGKDGRDGVILITTKDGNKEMITTELELRKFIAKRIKYPATARDAGITGTVTVLAKVDKYGELTLDKNTFPEKRIEEVVVVGYKPKDINSPEDEKDAFKALEKEAERVIALIHSIHFDGVKNKSVAFTIKFDLQ